MREGPVNEISRFFTLDEAVKTEHRQWIEPNRLWAEKYMPHVLRHARETMDHVRDILGVPVHVNSWVRCPGLNSAVGGSLTSDHTIGMLEHDQDIERVGATDFTAPAFGTPYEVALALRAATLSGKLQLRQLIYEHTWVHVSSPRLFRGMPERPLKQVLTLRRGGGYVPGIIREA